METGRFIGVSGRTTRRMDQVSRSMFSKVTPEKGLGRKMHQMANRWLRLRTEKRGSNFGQNRQWSGMKSLGRLIDRYLI
jgi:hypothetical protein